MEGAFGYSFSEVRVHLGGLPEAIGANAFARGSDLFFKHTNYDPRSRQGQALIGHELAHVVQQRQGRVSPTLRIAGLEVNGDRGLEAEADQLGTRAADSEAQGFGRRVGSGVSSQETPRPHAAGAPHTTGHNPPVQFNGKDLEAERRRAVETQQHGGYRAPRLGAFLEKFGSVLGGSVGAALPAGTAQGRAARTAVGGFLGKGLESVGGAIRTGLPVDRPQYDILTQDQGLSSEEALEALRFRKE